MYYINKQGGIHSLSLLYLTVELWEWYCLHHVFPQAIHISTEDNYITDWLSRLPTRTHEWTLEDTIFLSICRRWGYPSIDLFATRDNAKCPRYCSRAGFNTDSLGDAFKIDWSGEFLYIFPPIPMILKTVIIFMQYSTNAIIIALDNRQ